MIFCFFGYPGIGKDYCARKLADLVSITHINADGFHTEKEKRGLISGTYTKKGRLKYLKRIIKYIKQTFSKGEHLTIGDSIPDQDSKQLLLSSFGTNIIFIHVYAPKNIHLKRLSKRKDHFFTQELLNAWIKKHWEPINISYIMIDNSKQDSKELEDNLLKIYQDTISKKLNF